MLFGGNLGALPIVQWDDKLIGSGTVGKYAVAFRKLFLEDVRHAFGDPDQLISVDVK